MLKNGKLTTKALALAIISALPSMAVAEGTLTIRGGYGTSSYNYPFAYDYSRENVFEADYGLGAYVSAAYANDAMFGPVGGEVSLTYNHLSGDQYDNVDDCDVVDIIAVSHDDCVDGARTSNDTSIGQLRIMADYDLSNSGLQLLGGFGVLQVSSDISGQTVYPGEYSKIARSTDYTGLGLVAGARKTIPITNNAILQLEGFGGVYSGDRELNIADIYLTSGDKLSNSERETVLSLDLAASVAIPVDRIARGGMFEFGVAYTRLFNVMDTSNYNLYTDGGPSSDYDVNPGSLNDDIDALSLFFGLQIPL